MSYSVEKLRKLGIKVLDYTVAENEIWRKAATTSGWSERKQSITPVFECRICGKDFIPDTNYPGNFKHGYWVCPNNCNTGATRWTKKEREQIKFID